MHQLITTTGCKLTLFQMLASGRLIGSCRSSRCVPEWQTPCACRTKYTRPLMAVEATTIHFSWQETTSDGGPQASVSSKSFLWRDTARVLHGCTHSPSKGTWQPTHRGFVCLHNETGQPGTQNGPTAPSSAETLKKPIRTGALSALFCKDAATLSSCPDTGDAVCLSIGARLREVLLPAILQPMSDPEALLAAVMSTKPGLDPGERLPLPAICMLSRSVQPIRSQESPNCIPLWADTIWQDLMTFQIPFQYIYSCREGVGLHFISESAQGRQPAHAWRGIMQAGTFKNYISVFRSKAGWGVWLRGCGALHICRSDPGRPPCGSAAVSGLCSIGHLGRWGAGPPQDCHGLHRAPQGRQGSAHIPAQVLPTIPVPSGAS